MLAISSVVFAEDICFEDILRLDGVQWVAVTKIKDPYTKNKQYLGITMLNFQGVEIKIEAENSSAKDLIDQMKAKVFKFITK